MSCNEVAPVTCQKCSDITRPLPGNLHTIGHAVARAVEELPPQYGIRLYVEAGAIRLSLDRQQAKRRLIPSNLANLVAKLQETIDMAIAESQQPSMPRELGEKRAHVRELAWRMGYDGKPLPASAGVAFIAQYQSGRRAAYKEGPKKSDE